MRSGMGLVALAAVALTGGCAALPPVRVTAADAKRPIELQKGQDLYVALASNPTTGYSWTWPAKPDAILELRGEPTYEAAPAGGAVVGKGGTQTFWFRAIDRGSQKLRLLYERPFEKGVKPIDVQVFDVRVQ
jgi:inhibitor of cysteine peptidase